MPLQILPGSAVITIRNIIGLLFGQPGVGKTSAFFTADAPLLFDFDQGAHRSQFRRDIVQVSTWSEIADLDPTRDFAGYKTIGIDTTGRCLDALTLEIIRDDPKAKRRDGSLSIQGWGALKTKFVGWLKLVQGAGLDVVLLAHDKEERKGDDRIVRPDIQGGSYAEVFKRCDFIGYSFMAEGKRQLDFNPTDEWVGKNPGGFERIAIPDFNGAPEFLARVIAETKDKLGQLSEGSIKITEQVEFWRSLIADAADVSAVNTAMEMIVSGERGELEAAAKTQVRALLMQRAKDLGLTYNGESHCFRSREETEEEKAARLEREAFDEAPSEEPADEVKQPEETETEPFDLSTLAPGDVVDYLKPGKPGEEPVRLRGKVDRLDGESLLVVPLGKTRAQRVPLKPSTVQLVEKVGGNGEEPAPLPVKTEPTQAAGGEGKLL